MKRKESKHVRGIVDGLLQRWERTDVRKSDALREAWEETANKETKKHAFPVNIKNGTITVIVENSAWLYSLTLKKRDLLEQFNANYKGRKKAKEIRFRVGSLGYYTE